MFCANCGLSVRKTKIIPKNFANTEKSCKFAIPFGNDREIEIWCNGSTTDSGSVSEGSSPSISTSKSGL